MTWTTPQGRHTVNRTAILRLIEEENASFKRLREATGLTDPTLTKHLNQLIKDKLIKRAEPTKTGQVPFVLTDKGKGQEQLIRENVAKAFQVLKDLSGEYPAADAMVALSQLSKDDPKFFTELMQWMTECMALMRSKDMIKWIVRHGDSSLSILEDKVKTRLLAEVTENGFQKLEPSKQLILILQRFLDVMSEIGKERQ